MTKKWGQEVALKDKEIREPLFEFLEETYGIIRILEEKVMGSSRADVIMVTREYLYGIEIKSDADSYARLAGQVKDYDKYYDFNYVVVGTSHALHIRDHVPEYWGVITVEEVDGFPDFYILRHPCPNPKVTWKRKLEILWRPELAKLQLLYGMPKYKDKRKSFVADKIIEWMEAGKIEEPALRVDMCILLLERDYRTIRQELKEYRRGEIEKALDHETDPEKRVELLAKKAAARGNLRNLKRRPRRRRRRY